MLPPASLPASPVLPAQGSPANEALSSKSKPASETNNKQPEAVSNRFILELEFVLCLSNPYYLSHLATTYPHLLNPPSTFRSQRERDGGVTKDNHHRNRHGAKSDRDGDITGDGDENHIKFARYLAYLYHYWRRPEYARFLTHPGATLRNLELLQQEQFRADIIRPDVIQKLLISSTTSDTNDGGRPEDKNGAGAGSPSEQQQGKEEERSKKESDKSKVADGQLNGG